MCFHAEALSDNRTRQAAHSLRYPILVSVIIVSHFPLVSYTTSHMLERGRKLCNEVEDTAPDLPQSLASHLRGRLCASRISGRKGVPSRNPIFFGGRGGSAAPSGREAKAMQVLWFRFRLLGLGSRLLGFKV